MKKLNLFGGGLLFLVLVLCTGVSEIPQTTITNGLITIKLFLPDKGNGYYRGTRFDWAGVIPELIFKGHTYFGQWNSSNDPYLHDAIMGPVEEFMVMGFEETPVGSQFLKIGVGGLIKPDDKQYSFSRNYEVKNPGKWTVTKEKDRVVFIHDIAGVDGYAYRYTKVVKLVNGMPMLVLEHSLKNTGSKAIETSTYNHNFFVIDGEPTNENIKLSFPYPVLAEGSGFGTLATVNGKSISYTRALIKGENVYTSGLKGFGASPKDYNLFIQNLKSGANVRITSDRPIDKMVYWSCSTTACPEPYVKVSVKPGQEKKWKINYEFSANE